MTAISHALAKAQQKLMALRREQNVVATPSSDPPPFIPTEIPTTKPTNLPRPLPGHLGWESTAVTRALQRAQQVPSVPSPAVAQPAQQQATPATHTPAPNKTHLLVYGDLAMALLRHEQVAPGRVWLLLRHLDHTGRGWLHQTEVRHALTHQDSPVRICGWRHLRSLLAKGNGVFWQRRSGRLWLCSLAKVTHTLGVAKLTGRRVEVPIQALCQPIGRVRATCYDVFHSGRAHQNPISRASLTQLSGTTAQTQRAYEQRARVVTRRNYGVGAVATAVTTEETAGEKGHAYFQLTDKRGKHGRANTTYVAWQLPNSYHGTLTQKSKTHKKRINRQLVDLLHKGITGNDETWLPKRFYAHGADAVKGRKRIGAEHGIYWPSPTNRAQGAAMWYHIQE